MVERIVEKRGRCFGCRKIYQWAGPPLVSKAVCPKCRVRLERCRSLDPGEKLYQTPEATAS